MSGNICRHFGASRALFGRADSAMIGPPMAEHTSPPSIDAAELPDAGEALRLAEAFRIFNQASEELSTAYTALQSQVAELTAELAAANGALRQQFLERMALAERLALLLDALPAGVVVIGSEGRVDQSNPAAAGIFGRDLSNIEWSSLQSLLLPGQIEGEFSIAGRAIAMQQTPLDSAGGCIVLLHDVTETHNLKQQAERHQRLAAMGEMAAQLAHQLRTPLAAALLYAGNLELPEVAPAARISIAGKTVSRLKHLEKLIQDMLLFAKGETLGREPVVLSDLIEEMRQTFEPLANERGLQFQAVMDASITLICNRKAVASALVSLIENAFDATASTAGGLVSLSVLVATESVSFVVEDNGRGISAEVQARLFEPFFTTRNEGTGLGLAIARGVARAHGGNIEVSSAPDRGTRFVLRLARAANDTEIHEPT